MKEKREKYEKPQLYAIEMEQPLMSGSTVGISPNPDNKPGPVGARRNEFEDDWAEDNWAEDNWAE